MPVIQSFDKRELLRQVFSMTRIIIDPDIEGAEKQLIKQYLPAHSYAVVSDEQTHGALGARIVKALSAAKCTHVSLRHHPDASMENVERIRKESAHHQAIIAVGSGTINDLCKYAAHSEMKPYMIFATAPSMNGYLSSTASISEKGRKHSLPCTPPKALICDLSVLTRAPVRLIQSGLGDSLCRPTAEADWLLSHLLLGTSFYDEAFQLTAEFEEDLFNRGELLQRGDLESIALLMQTLIASGKAMLLAGGSFPASQGEHMLAHTMELLYPEACKDTYHGEQIGVLTLLMANLQRKILMRSAPLQIHWEDPPEEWDDIFRRKIPDPAFLHSLNTRLQTEWKSICAHIRPFTLQPVYLRGVLEAAGAPTTVEELGWNREQVEKAARLAPFTRERFTFLDLAVLSGGDSVLW